MTYLDWTFSGDGDGDLDAATKYAGNSSYVGHHAVVHGALVNSYLTHNTFYEPKAQIESWIRKSKSGYHTIYADVRCKIQLSSFGICECHLQSESTWEKHRISFWYDVGSNKKFSRDERWNGTEWVKTSADNNHGDGIPGAGTIALIVQGYLSQPYGGINVYGWFDEVKITP